MPIDPHLVRDLIRMGPAGPEGLIAAVHAFQRVSDARATVTSAPGPNHRDVGVTFDARQSFFVTFFALDPTGVAEVCQVAGSVVTEPGSLPRRVRLFECTRPEPETDGWTLMRELSAGDIPPGSLQTWTISISARNASGEMATSPKLSIHLVMPRE